MRRTLATAAILACTLTLAGCGDDDDKSTNGSQDTVTIKITVEGDSVTPNGDRIEISRGQPVELVVTSDAPGEIHVHSEPEQDFEYDAGTTTLPLEDLDTPGVIDVESHTLDKTIVQLEVR